MLTLTMEGQNKVHSLSYHGLDFYDIEQDKTLSLHGGGMLCMGYFTSFNS